MKWPEKNITNFPEGTAVVLLPTNMSLDSVLEFEEWIGLILRRLKRNAGEKNEAKVAEANTESAGRVHNDGLQDAPQ